jgi:hypothetical protein
VLTHRLIVKPESRLRGRTDASVLSDILLETAVELGEIV